MEECLYKQLHLNQTCEHDFWERLHFIDKGLFLTQDNPLKIMTTEQWPEPIFTFVWTQCWGSFHKVHILVIMKQSLAQQCKFYIPQAKVNKTNEVQWNKLLVQQGNFSLSVCFNATVTEMRNYENDCIVLKFKITIWNFIKICHLSPGQHLERFFNLNIIIIVMSCI